MKYLPYVDGLRSLSIFSVVSFHFFPEYFSGGFIGVDIFLVISGFLISLHIIDRMLNNDFSFLDFYERRIG